MTKQRNRKRRGLEGARTPPMAVRGRRGRRRRCHRGQRHDGVGSDDEAQPRRALRQPTVVTEEMLVEVDVVDNDYEPRDLTVCPGATVHWEWKGRAAHDVTEDEGEFGSPVQSRGSFKFTFDDPGTYYYYCTLHHAMQGTVTVRP